MFSAANPRGFVLVAVVVTASLTLLLAPGACAGDDPDRTTVAALDRALEESRGYDVPTLDTLGPSERSRVDGGRTVAILEEIPGSPVKIGRGIGIIPYPPVVVVQVLNDFEHYKQVMPYTRESIVDKERSGGDVIYFYSEIKAPLVAVRYFGLKIVTEEKVDGVPGTFFNSWTLDPEKESNLYLSSGSWKLVPYGPDGGRTLAFYTVITDPGGSIPDFVKNRSTEVAIPGVYEAIAKRAAEGLASGIYELPPPEDQVERAVRQLIAETRGWDASYVDSLPAGDGKRLLEGDFLVSMEDVQGTWLKMARGVSVFRAPPDRVYRTIADYNTYARYIPYVAESTVDAARSTQTEVYLYQRLDFGIILVKDRYYTIRLTHHADLHADEDAYFIEWVLDPSREHNVIKNAGSWKLVPLGPDGTRTLVFYTVMADPGGFSPWFWKNLSARKALVHVLQAIQMRAEMEPAE